MQKTYLDLRSDTVTRPTAGMRQAMADAPVGDDVLNDDPTVHQLQDRLAEMLGKEAAIFVPSGTMSNQIAVRLHCGPGDEFICESGCHIYNYEQAGYAQLSGVAARAVDGDSGVLEAEQLFGLIRPENEHLARTKLVCLENSHNRGGGRILPFDGTQAICDWAHESGLATHLDGARLFNVVVATGIQASRWAALFDTVSVCFSKGLGAPVGSVLAGPKEMIDRARRHRKLFDGGMRQAGIIAAGALYALENHVERLAEDHEKAQRLAAVIRSLDGLELRPAEVDTNLVIFEVDRSLGSAAEFAARLKERGLLVTVFGPRLIRAVTHLDVTLAEIDQAAEILEAAVQSQNEAPAITSAAHSAYSR